MAPDVEVSEAALVKLWGRDGDLPDYQARAWLTEFERRALVFVAGESPERWVSLHDVQQKYLQENLQDGGCFASRMVCAAMAGGSFLGRARRCRGRFISIGRGLIISWLRGRRRRLGSCWGILTGCSGSWRRTDIEQVLADFAVLSCPEPFLSRLERTLRLSAHVLNEDKGQLASHGIKP